MCSRSRQLRSRGSLPISIEGPAAPGGGGQACIGRPSGVARRRAHSSCPCSGCRSQTARRPGPAVPCSAGGTSRADPGRHHEHQHQPGDGAPAHRMQASLRACLGAAMLHRHGAGQAAPTGARARAHRVPGGAPSRGQVPDGSMSRSSDAEPSATLYRERGFCVDDADRGAEAATVEPRATRVRRPSSTRSLGRCSACPSSRAADSRCDGQRGAQRRNRRSRAPGGPVRASRRTCGPGGERVAWAQGGEPRRVDPRIERAAPDQIGDETARRRVGGSWVETPSEGGLVKERDGA